MMTEIIRELTALKKTSRITREQVLCQTRRVEVQRVQKAIFDMTKERSEFDDMSNSAMSQTAQKEVER